jgi:hypothetical protein
MRVHSASVDHLKGSIVICVHIIRHIISGDYIGLLAPEMTFAFDL